MAKKLSKNNSAPALVPTLVGEMQKQLLDEVPLLKTLVILGLAELRGAVCFQPSNSEEDAAVVIQLQQFCDNSKRFYFVWGDVDENHKDSAYIFDVSNCVKI